MLVQASPISSWWNGDKGGLSEVKGLGVQPYTHTHTYTHTCILQVFSLACLFTSPTLKYSLRTPRLLLLCLPGPYSPIQAPTPRSLLSELLGGGEVQG